MVKKFAGVQEADSKSFISGDMLSVEKLTKSLIQSADAYYTKWRSDGIALKALRHLGAVRPHIEIGSVHIFHAPVDVTLVQMGSQ